MTVEAENKPRWFVLGDQLMWPLVGMGCTSARYHRLSTPDLQWLAELAICHHAGCLEASDYANRRGKHSAAVCLVRQSIEALTIAEIGLQLPAFAEPLLSGWKEGKKSHDELRKALEKDIWPTYGCGLWDESWAEFYGNLARAVQPYAHYTSELQGWQFVTVAYEGGEQFTAMTGLETYDPLQATRITLFHMLLTYMLGRILLVHGKNADALSRRAEILELGQALGSSKLLFQRGEWGAQLAPHMLFKPDHDWRDDT
ncbi:MAG: hypothetical protein ACRETQ_04445 [Gammaproteobacteria bacterium]